MLRQYVLPISLAQYVLLEFEQIVCNKFFDDVEINDFISIVQYKA